MKPRELLYWPEMAIKPTLNSNVVYRIALLCQDGKSTLSLELESPAWDSSLTLEELKLNEA